MPTARMFMKPSIGLCTSSKSYSHPFLLSSITNKVITCVAYIGRDMHKLSPRLGSEIAFANLNTCS
jgi:hypothetical protein